MKKTNKPGLLFITLLLALFATTLQAQTTKAPQPRYKDVVIENPNAEADIKVVSDFLNALTSGDLNKAKSQLAAQYKGYGPSPADSATVDQTISNWTENYKTQLDRKVSFVYESFKVLSGDLKGNYVSVWVITVVPYRTKKYLFLFNILPG